MFKHLTFTQTFDKPEAPSRIEGMLLNEQCQRCGGLMIHDYCLDVGSDTGEVEVQVMRCCACGELIDPTILRNRAQPHEEVQKQTTRRRVYRKNPQGLVHQN